MRKIRFLHLAIKENALLNGKRNIRPRCGFVPSGSGKLGLGVQTHDKAIKRLVGFRIVLCAARSEAGPWMLQTVMTKIRGWPHQSQPLVPANPLLELRRVALRAAVQRRVVDRNAAFGHHFLKVPLADAVAAVPADAEQDHLGRKPAALEHRHRGGDAPKTRLLAVRLRRMRPTGGTIGC